MAKTILIIAAHSDDQIIGPGGAAAKYAEEGFDVKTIIFTKGEVAMPHFKEEIIVDTRERESIRADKVIGGKGVKFLKVPEKDINKEVEIYKGKNKLEKIIKKLRPVKIFTHAPDDAHPIHRKTVSAVLEIVDELSWKTEVYSFEIWNPFRFTANKHPKLVVDTSKTFDKKLKALKCFKSQFSLHGIFNYFPVMTMYIKNTINGRKHNTKYAEVFYRLR
ncbi:PIG-L family deacetylase [Candidatus Woesearchaeota archaeon]|nr:PIG-L family deacetylase [Candidatus Woesearchaeota archaeon]